MKASDNLLRQAYADAAKALIARVIPGYANHFWVEIIFSDNQNDIFEIESVDNKIVLRGNSPVSVASALYWYLKYYCHCHISWNGNNLNMPEVLPVVSSKVTQVSKFNYRAYLNYCTFCYTMPWWDWERWQREIDWMALHGITMPLAVTGLEAVWQATLRRFNLDDVEIREFLTGPAFSAWQWMGNIERWGGPLPQSWIDSHLQLGQQIIQRELELGMTPVLQGFSGCVPSTLKSKFPQAHIGLQPLWFGVPPGSAQLNPLSTLSADIGKVFLKEQRKLLGESHYFAVDPFHEGTPPEGGDEYLHNVGKHISKLIIDFDPKAVLVMQTWSLKSRIAQSVPQGHLLLFSITGTNWKKYQSFWGRPWVAGVLHNYGGRVYMGGDLQHYASNAHDLLKNPDAGNLQGVGVFPEGSGHNPLVYELATEIAWLSDPPDMAAWLPQYLRARYGQLTDSVAKAWKLLSETVYGQKYRIPSMESPICSRPALNFVRASLNGGIDRDYAIENVFGAWGYLLDGAADLAHLDTYRYDLVDLARQCLADLSLSLHQNIAEAYAECDNIALEAAGQVFLELMDDMDDLLATRKEFLLGKWLSDAGNWGTTTDEKRLFEKNALVLLTTWGPKNPNSPLFDYANRQWAGMIRGYYKPRWEKFINFLLIQPAESEKRFREKRLRKLYDRPAINAHPFYRELAEWEYEWCAKQQVYPSLPLEDELEQAQHLFDRWAPLILKKR